jgi:hypothetical protein
VFKTDLKVFIGLKQRALSLKSSQSFALLAPFFVNFVVKYYLLMQNAVNGLDATACLYCCANLASYPAITAILKLLP